MEWFLVLLLALGARSAAKQEQQSGEQSSGGGAPPPPKEDPGVDVGALVNTTKDVFGIAGSIVGAVAGTAVTAGGVAAGVGGGAAASAAGAGTGSIAGGAATLGGGGSATGGGGGALTGAAVGLSAGGAGALVIVGIAALFVIAKEIVKAQEKDKDWQQLLLGLNANARALNAFELDMVDAVLSAFRGNRVTGLRLVGPVESVVDPRLEGPIPFSTQVRGRGYFQFRRMNGGDTDNPVIWRGVRALAYEYLFWRAIYGYRLLRNWTAVMPEPDWGLTYTKRSSLYDNDTAGLGRVYRADDPTNTIYGPLGGLDNVPSAANGWTVVPRANGSEDLPPSLELIGDGRWNTPGEAPPQAMKLMRLRGLIAALGVLRSDPRPTPGDSEAERAQYAETVWRGLRVGWISDKSSAWDPRMDAVGITLAGKALELDPDLFGVRASVEPAALKRNEPAWHVEGL